VAGAELLGKKLEGETDSDDEGSDGEGGSDEEMGSDDEDEGEEGSGMDVGSDDDDNSEGEEEEEVEPEPSAKKRKVGEGRHKQQQQAEEGSLRQLKKAADAAKAAAKAAANGEGGEGDEGEGEGVEDGEQGEVKTPVEYERFLTNEDFARIRALQAEATMENALTKVGAKRAKGVANEELEALKVRAAVPIRVFRHQPPPHSLARPHGTSGNSAQVFPEEDCLARTDADGIHLPSIIVLAKGGTI